MITPIRFIDIFIFREDNIYILEDGNIRLNKILVLLAPNILNNFICSVSQERKPFNIVIVVTITLISKPLNIIELVFVPIIIMIKGPKATFGKLLITIINGSSILLSVLNIYRVKDKINEIIPHRIKEIITSYVVLLIWLNRLLVWYSSTKVFNTLEGEENRNELIIFNRDKTSHKTRKIMSNEI